MISASTKDQLKYRRQYVVAPQDVDCPFQYNTYRIGCGYFLYSHIDLKVTEYKSKNISIYLLGDIFDYRSPKKDNIDILRDLPLNNFDQILKATDLYCGRYVLLYCNNDDLKIVNDATATRKVYYSLNEDKIWCSSSFYLLANILRYSKTKNELLLQYYNSNSFELLHNANIGDSTCFDEIKQLLPNHFLDLSNFEIKRFWPYKKLEKIDIDEAAEKCSKMLKGFMEAIGNRYEVMLPVTAGKDSRLLVAATKDIKDKVYYYINKETTLSDSSLDIAVPKKLFDDLGLQFHVLDPYIEIDSDFKEIYYSNNELATDKYLPHIYNYYKYFESKINLPGNFVASCLEMYGLFDRKLNGKILADINFMAGNKYANEYFDNWLDEIKPICNEYNIEILAMFYWEERLANWGTQVHIDKDIAQEDIVPYNSRELNRYFLSVDPKYIDRPDYVLFRKMIQRLWPELLAVPFNPSFKNNVISFFKTIRLWKLIRKFQYGIKAFKLRLNKKRLYSLFFISAFISLLFLQIVLKRKQVFHFHQMQFIINSTWLNLHSILRMDFAQLTL